MKEAVRSMLTIIYLGLGAIIGVDSSIARREGVKSP